MTLNISRRDFIKSTTIALTSFSVSGCVNDSKLIDPVKKQNIIFILADDLGYGDLGCYGQKIIKTTNIDKMASEGMLFTQHYSGSTVCAPSRCSLMTGLHTGHCRISDNTKGASLQEEDFTLGQLCRSAGYKTAVIGKWGLGEASPGLPNDKGFDYFFGYLNQVHAHNYYPEYLWRNGEKVFLHNKVLRPTNSYAEANEYGGVATECHEYSHDLFTNEAIKYIEANSNNPFFLYLAYTIPHANNESQLVCGKHGMEIPDTGIYADRKWDDAQKSHAAMISKLDSDVGKILQTIKDNGLDQDTIVIFTSDNGPHKEGGADPDFFDSNRELRGIKRDLYEGGIRVPMIVWWPCNVKKGTKCEHISAFWDFLPTIGEIAGKKVDSETDGISMLPALLGSNEQIKHKYLYWKYPLTGEQAVRIDNWKVIKKKGAVELYELSKDISEQDDISHLHYEILKLAAEYMEQAENN